MFKQILVTLDGSDTAEKALDYAIDLARKDNAGLTLLTVVEPRDSTSRTLPPEMFEPYPEEVKAGHMAILNRSLKKVQEKAPEVEVDTKIAYGNAANLIVETCKEGTYDLVVMGSRGRGGIKGLLLGSVSRSVANEAPIPVLIIK
jgi:nucleotide-binding universal stress UspA family protein